MKFDFSIDKKEFDELKKGVREVVEALKIEIKRCKIDADVFIGGSFAKGTMAPSDEYDVDIFIRFDWKYEKISEHLDRVIRNLEKDFKIERVHGSRDYFKVYKNRKYVYEIIPVVRIRKVNAARNVTDLSYFHVNYVKRKLKEKMKKEVVKAKKFCKACGVYGAESYIGGFSGYGLECLIIYFKSFDKMLKELIKLKERAIFDPAKKYGKKENVLYEMNEAKLNSPIVLVDPTFKERNVLAALSRETFRKFQESAKNYLRKPNAKYFEKKKFDEERQKKKARRQNAEFVKIVLRTNRQEGDIAGTKMKKFSRFIGGEVGKYFYVSDENFSYEEEQEAEFCFIAKSKKEIVRIGPSLEQKDNVRKFRQKNKNTFEKNDLVHAKIKINFSAKEFLERFIETERERKMKEMGIVEMKVS